MSNDKAPRRWTSTEIATARRTGDDIGLPDDFVDSSAYDAILKERDELKSMSDFRLHCVNETQEILKKMGEELLRERRKVEKLREFISFVRDAQCECSVMERQSGHLTGCWFPEFIDKLEAIDKEGDE